MRTSNSYIGSHIERVEDFRFLRGEGQYLDDLSRKDQWHAAFLRSSVGHGVIRKLDASKALAVKGVRAVVTAADIEGEIPTIPFRRPNPTIGPYAQPVIAHGKVRYFGEPVAMVLADTAALAEDALQEIELEIEQLPAVVDRESAMANRVLLFEATGSNLVSVFHAEKGDAAAAFARADFVLREQFSTQRQTALPMEPRGLLAEWDASAGRLSVFGAAKLPFFNRKSMAKMMRLPEAAVDYIEVDVGGGFGARGEFYPEDFLVAFGARKFGRPVKWIEDRREHLMAIGHARESSCDVELALRNDGTILGLRGDLYVNVGAYVRPNGMTPVRNAAQFMSGPYRTPSVKLEAHAFVSNKTPAGTYRGPGRYEGCFYMERLIDMAANALGLDRLDIRRRNLVTQEEMPYPLASVLPSDGRADTACDSGDYRVTFDRCVAESGWAEKAALQGKFVDGRYHGLGIACFIEGGASGPQENVRLALERDGSVSLYAGSSAIGQGLETILGQIAADALEIPMERIRVFHGSTTYLKEGWGSYGSRATVMGGSAVLDGARKLLDLFRAAAGRRLGLAPSDLTVTDGIARAPDGRSVPLAEVAVDGLEADGSFKNQTPTYTYGAAVAHVAVDPGTGHVEVVDYLVVDDVGRIINPLTLHGQVMGAAVQGFGSVFSEELVYNADGLLLVGSLADYLVPLATDYPHVRCVSMESYPSPTNPLGAKGAGEGGIIPVGGAVANAVANALGSFGVQPRVLPLSPARVWELIEQGRGVTQRFEEMKALRRVVAGSS
ncbi:MAG TPA: xanthine dehydrogenase family protein molybdopterin-binding subunit [Beijerinckiaceae bacterium]|nr:xanthine dehydrogenase family protein molybdopterin-binding subunit [Beijerinckiaceae bacterium]